MKKERDCLLEVMNAYMIGKEKLEETLLGKEVVMNAVTQSIIDLGSTVNHLETRKSFLIKTKKRLLPVHRGRLRAADKLQRSCWSILRLCMYNLRLVL